MTIQEAIDKCQNVQVDQYVSFKFSYKGKAGPKTYELISSKYGINSPPLMSVSEGGWRSMNILKATKQYITLYDYNMMGVRSSYKMAIDKIQVIEETTKS